MKKLGLMLAAFVVCGCSTAIAQTESAAISGRVVDNTGAVVVGAQVTATNIDMGTPSTTKTNGEGFYLLPGLKPGRYRIAIKKEGFRQIVKTEIELHVQDVVAENFKLDVGAVSEAITVTAEAATVNTRDGSVSTVIDQTYVKNMPLNGRSFQDLILLTPGVTTQTTQVNSTTVGVGQTGEFSVNGQRTEANYYTVDGVSANAGIGASTGDNPLGYSGPSGSVAASTALGTTQALVSVDDLQEFRIQSSTYSAEYGRNPGGQFAFQTKSGTNSWHGTAYDYVRNNFFDANNYFNNYHSLPQPPLHQNDFGGTLGGPLRVPHLYDGKDKTFFFFSYEGLRLLQPQPAAVVPVPDACMRGDAASCPIVSPSNGTICPTMNSFPDCVQRTPANAAVLPVVNAFPKPSPNDTTADPVNGVGHFIGSWGNPGSLDSLSVRLDQKIKDRTSLFFRFSDTSSDTSFLGFQGNPPSMSTTTSYVLRTYTGGATTLFSNRLSNEVRLNYTSNNQRSGDHMVATGGAVPANLGQITELGPDALTQVAFILGGNFMAVDTTKDQSAQRQWNLVETASFTTGRHQLRFGVDYRRLSPFVVPHPLNAVYLFFDEPSVEQGSTGALLGTEAPAHPLYKNLSLFATDDWRVTSRLNLSFGARWEINPPPGVTQGMQAYTVQGATPDTYTLAPQGTPLWKTTWHNFAPRLGVAYSLRDNQGWQTVLRAGAGLFYDTGQQLGSLAFEGPGFNASSCCYFGPFPGTASTGLTFPTNPNPPTPPFGFLVGYGPDFRLPYTIQWSAAVEQGLGKSQSLSLTYVGSRGDRLLQKQEFKGADSCAGVTTSGCTTNPIINHDGFSEIATIQNGLSSDYNALQAQFRRQLRRGLTALASYTWAHCFDYGSFNFQFGVERGNCATDVRNSFSGALSYDLPNVSSNGFVNALLQHWGVDDRLTFRSGFPIDIGGTTLFNPVTGERSSSGVSFVPGKPVYIYGAQCTAVFANDFPPPQGQTALPCPGGRAINPDAFEPVSSGLGDVPRNSIRGFGAWQMDLAVRREFRIYERLKLQFRAEAFNVFNHPNFGVIDGGCNGTPGVPGCKNPLFGQATASLANSLGVLSPLYQMGGPRSMQFALKLVF